mgnify:CR=1 FL=1
MILELIALLVLSIVMVIILVAYWRLSRKYKSLERRETQMLNSAHRKAEEIVLQAKQKALNSIVTTQVNVDEKLGEAIDKVSKAKVHQALEDYKMRKLNQMDKDFRQVLLDAGQKVLGKTLNLQEHEALIIKSLETAKKNHVF